MDSLTYTKRLSIDKTHCWCIFSLSILSLYLKKRIHATFWDKSMCVWWMINQICFYISWMRIYSKRVTVRKYLTTKTTIVTNHVTILSPLCIRVVLLGIKDFVHCIPYQERQYEPIHELWWHTAGVVFILCMALSVCATFDTSIINDISTYFVREQKKMCSSCWRCQSHCVEY